MEFIVRPVQATMHKEEPLKVIPVAKSGGSKDRRKKKQDRRKSVRDGVVVSLSVNKKDRRRPGDRRKTGG